MNHDFKLIILFHLAQDEPDLDPKFSVFPTSYTAEEGQRIQIDCHVEGTKPITGNINFN